ncbi:hypothetical protein GN956_G12221 [Arapaima gigas]
MLGTRIQSIQYILVFGRFLRLEDRVQRDDGFPEEHVEPDERPVHHGQDQIAAPRGVGASTIRLQQAGQQLEGALLLPLRGRSFLHDAGGELLLAQLDDGVHVAGTVLALRPQAPAAKHRHLDVGGHPSLVVLHIQQRHLKF